MDIQHNVDGIQNVNIREAAGNVYITVTDGTGNDSVFVIFGDVIVLRGGEMRVVARIETPESRRRIAL